MAPAAVDPAGTLGDRFDRGEFTDPAVEVQAQRDLQHLGGYDESATARTQGRLARFAFGMPGGDSPFDRGPVTGFEP